MWCDENDLSQPAAVSLKFGTYEMIKFFSLPLKKKPEVILESLKTQVFFNVLQLGVADRSTLKENQNANLELR